MEELNKKTHWYLHVDLDAFFASVEQLDNPELRGKPVIVGGKPEDRRSVVSTASYEARAFGVHSAMPTFQAYRLCPQGIFVHGRMHRYAELSHQIMNIFRDYSPDVDQMSIDEAFIDLTGTEKLFGPPEETARAIKKRVKEETGLTVSVGLATTKYLAKISSGLSKPDGFFQIKAGEEESFMLRLPLNKVWGLGPKSLELIRSKGFNSTRDIYERDYDTLEFLFGKNMASFLYNVVRGIEKESFSRESKSHSISAESTFPYDLTDLYTIETELLELAHGVFFRLLKEGGFSRTAFVKIRYDDFSTVTVQETLERNIITLDSFFEIIKKLFEKRYENGRGVRLLGLGFDNIVKEEKPYQQDLFSENNDEKKQAVEKAILKLSQKHPEIKVNKARTLKVIFAAILMASIPFKSQAEETQNIPEAPLAEEAPASLFDYDINDKNHVEFSASGLWKAELTTGLDFSFGNDTAFSLSPVLPVFKQETDFSTLLTLNKSWYFEAAFAEEFTKNTLAFGYKGKGIIRDFRLANRGITLPQGYSAEYFGYSLRGGNNQAPGASLQLLSPSENIQADFLLRYDMTETKSEIYYGMNRVSDLKISADAFSYGREFIFPESASSSLLEIKGIYVEDKSGSHHDSRNKSYRKLSADEYALAKNKVYISHEAGGGINSDGNIPSILVTFTSAGTPSSIITQSGNWNDPGSFFGNIQKELGAGNKYQIQSLVEEMLTEVDGEPSLIIQNSKGFSPFLCPSVYETGRKKESSNSADYLVIAEKSEIPVSKFKAIEANEAYTDLYEDFFNSGTSTITIINKDRRESVYPFAEDCPELYLKLPHKAGFAIRARSYSPVKEIIISKKAAAGTVQVYKNGNLLNGIIFNENTGVIELNTPVSNTDQLLITWQEETNDYSAGALAAAAGLKINFLPELKGDFLLTTRQPVNEKNKYADYGSRKNSFTALSTGIVWEKYGVTVSNKTALSLLNDNTSEGLLLYSWQDIINDWNKEQEANPLSKNPKPEKMNCVSFTTEDFSPYKKIVMELDFQTAPENQTGSQSSLISGPLTLILDEDTGSSEAGRQALILQLQKLEELSAATGIHKITVIPKEKQVLFDDASITPSSYSLTINEEITPSRLICQSSSSQTALVEKITYEEASYYGTIRNAFSAQYKNSQSLIKAGDFDILKDIFIKVDSDQGSGNFTKPAPYVTAKTQGGLTFSGLQLSADASFNKLTEKPEIAEAGHSIKTDEQPFLFKLFSFEDTYRYRTSVSELKKENNFSLNFNPIKIPLQTSLKTSAYNSQFQGRQNASVSASYTQKLFEGDAGISGKLEVSQSILQNKKDAVSSSYAESWADISSLEFSTGKEFAQERKSLWSYSLNGTIPLNKTALTIKPKLTYELSDTYKLSEDNSLKEENSASEVPLFTDKEFLSLLIPFTTEKKAFSFEISRNGGAVKAAAYGGNYQKDSEKLYSIQNERKSFYTSIPFYELFDSDLKNKLSHNYSAKYEGIFRRSLFNSKKDLYIPSSLSLAVSREINRQPPLADLYQFKAVITNNSINNFGSSSQGKQFSWFNQEEVTTSLSAILKVPAEEPSSYKINIQTFAQLLLFITEKAIVTEQFNFSFENAGDWDARNTLSYSRPSKVSLISDLLPKLFPAVKNSDYSISRKDSFTVGLGRVNAVFQQKYSYNHFVEIEFLDYYSLNAGLGGSLILNQKLADKININLTLGAKAEFN